MKLLAVGLLSAAVALAAPPNRIHGPVDPRATRVVKGTLHRLARPEADRGPLDSAARLDHVVLAFRPSPTQQADLDRLLADQQNPNSPRYRQWLAPEEFAARFGLSPSDESQAIAWLRSEGLEIRQQARGRNWLAFSGTAQAIGRALHTEFRRFAAGDGVHFANASEPSVPAALEEIVAGFSGLDDFVPVSHAHQVPVPDYNLSGSHYLVPEDFATIYNVSPLYKSGMDGTGQSIAVVGQSAADPADLQAFKTRHGLPANDPKMLPYSTDPGFTSAELEGDLDLEWAGAIAPKATIYYIYGTNAITAMSFAINLNVAPVITVSYGICETNVSPAFYRALAQQANAQGISILASSGDSGAAGCDLQGSAPLASKGMLATFPAVLPEVTAVGGTQFDEGSGSYWNATNSSTLGSALSYIPEKAWNESGSVGLLATGGGISRIYPKPAWQIASGITDAPFRHFPDVSLSAAGHDAYIVTYHSGLAAVSGTSAGAPSLAGVIALLNQYQVSGGYQAKAGLGNLNPQLYRLAQSAPNAFHDVTNGDNIVPCTLGSPDCVTGKYGYPTAANYDLATGLGSINAANLFVNWNSRTKPVSVNLVLGASRIGVNDSVNVTALVTAPTGGTPTGTVEFSANDVPLGSVTLVARDNAMAADLTIPAYLLGSGNITLVAGYSGDVAFSGGGATRTVQVTVPSGAAAVLITSPSAVWPIIGPDALGLSWQTTLTVREIAGVPARITGFSIDGQSQTLATYFPSTSITASGSLTATVLFRGISTPATHSFGFTGVDPAGNTWSRTATVSYMPNPVGTDFQATASPLVVNQTADPSCPWPIQVNVEDWGGSLGLITGLYVGAVRYTPQIVPAFGTERLEAWSSLQGTLCVSGVTPPASDIVEVDLSTGQYAQMIVSFAPPPASPVTVAATPAAVTLEARDAGRFAQATLSLAVSDRTADWTVTVLPGNRTTGWLTVSPLSGTGPAQLTLTARGAGFGDGAYRALLLIQSARAVPQTLTVPVMFVMGSNSSGIAILSAVNAATSLATAAPGSLIAVYGSQLAGATNLATGSPIPFANSGVTATVNGVPAPVVYASSNQLNVQVPYAAGAGPAVLGVNNNGQIAGVLFQVAASAPGVFTGALPASVKAGAAVTVYLTGIGEVTPALKTAYQPSTAVSGQAKPVLPVSVTVGGTQAFVQVAALAPNRIGTAQLTFTVPPGTPAGKQPLVITVGSASSPPVDLTVQ